MILERFDIGGVGDRVVSATQFVVGYDPKTATVQVVHELRWTCQRCGVSWPFAAPELDCTCPPNRDEGAGGMR